MGPPAPERPSRVATALRSAADRTRAKAPARAYQERNVPGVVRWVLSVMSSLGEWADATLAALRRQGTGGAPPVVEPDGDDVVIKGTAFPGDERTYLMLPFDVRPGTARLEVEYGWRTLPPAPPENKLTQTIFDLGLWDEHGYRSPDGFRGWSGSRHRKVWIEGDKAERSYRPGPILPGTWHVDLGVAAIGPTGAEWTVTIRAKQGPSVPAPDAKAVDRHHVARAEPGWYHGDFHMHAWHSNPRGPDKWKLVELARAAGLDFLPVTEYVVGHHWGEYGEVQEKHPDLVIWPGREIVTYFGHVQSLGETPGFVEFRHGFEDINIADIQREVRNADALFQVNHPTTFPGPLFQNFCRGCAFELGDEIDWDAVDTIEILTGDALVRPEEYDMPGVGVRVANPFFRSAIDLWEHLLNRGHKITAVCGSDDKKGDKYGTCATAVYAHELSRPAIMEALRAGRAYVRTRGVADSPSLEMTVTAPGAEIGTFGSVLHVDGPAQLRVTVNGGRSQSLRLVRNGDDLPVVPITEDVFEYATQIERVAGEGPLGTWYRVETLDGRGRTTVGNPVFLQAPVRE